MKSIFFFLLGFFVSMFYFKSTIQKYVLAQHTSLLPNPVFHSDECQLLDINSFMKNSRHTIGDQKMGVFYVDHALPNKSYVSVRVPKFFDHYLVVKKSKDVEIEMAEIPCGLNPQFAKYIRGATSEEFVYLNIIRKNFTASQLDPALQDLLSDSVSLLFYPGLAPSLETSDTREDQDSRSFQAASEYPDYQYWQ